MYNHGVAESQGNRVSLGKFILSIDEPAVYCVHILALIYIDLNVCWGLTCCNNLKCHYPVGGYNEISYWVLASFLPNTHFYKPAFDAAISASTAPTIRKESLKHIQRPLSKQRLPMNWCNTSNKRLL